MTFFSWRFFKFDERKSELDVIHNKSSVVNSNNHHHRQSVCLLWVTPWPGQVVVVRRETKTNGNLFAVDFIHSLVSVCKRVVCEREGQFWVHNRHGLASLGANLNGIGIRLDIARYHQTRRLLLYAAARFQRAQHQQLGQPLGTKLLQTGGVGEVIPIDVLKFVFFKDPLYQNEVLNGACFDAKQMSPKILPRTWWFRLSSLDHNSCPSYGSTSPHYGVAFSYWLSLVARLTLDQL